MGGNKVSVGPRVSEALRMMEKQVKADRELVLDSWWKERKRRLRDAVAHLAEHAAQGRQSYQAAASRAGSQLNSPQPASNLHGNVQFPRGSDAPTSGDDGAEAVSGRRSSFPTVATGTTVTTSSSSLTSPSLRSCGKRRLSGVETTTCRGNWVPPRLVYSCVNTTSQLGGSFNDVETMKMNLAEEIRRLYEDFPQKHNSQPELVEKQQRKWRTLKTPTFHAAIQPQTKAVGEQKTTPTKAAVAVAKFVPTSRSCAPNVDQQFEDHMTTEQVIRELRRLYGVSDDESSFM
ncbi:uncharacterized protein TEOVI_000259300 [Trypanosoma equiperdum]|uniref:Uncharacterized protein n=1 Tax=Trypanosoma equiperdum TaxID=5694 RepID=A0A1G4IFV4_TRYEQ|nr:hypothetical protein, conserved [Trypanosoma equiperdum]